VELDRDERCYVSHGSDNRVEFQKAVAFVKTVLPESPAAGIKKSQILDGREGADAEISSTTLACALSWLVKEGAVGEKQLMDKQGRPKVYSNQTPSLTNENGLNKSKGDSGAPRGAPEGAPGRGLYDNMVVEYADMSWIKPSVDIPSSGASGTESGEVAAVASAPLSLEEFFADPPEWVLNRLDGCREDPEKHLPRLCSLVVEELRGGGSEDSEGLATLVHERVEALVAREASGKKKRDTS
jgi:hypothetical protein